MATLLAESSMVEASSIEGFWRRVLANHKFAIHWPMLDAEFLEIN